MAAGRAPSPDLPAPADSSPAPLQRNSSCLNVSNASDLGSNGSELLSQPQNCIITKTILMCILITTGLHNYFHLLSERQQANVVILNLPSGVSWKPQSLQKSSSGQSCLHRVSSGRRNRCKFCPFPIFQRLLELRSRLLLLEEGCSCCPQRTVVPWPALPALGALLSPHSLCWPLSHRVTLTCPPLCSELLRGGRSVPGKHTDVLAVKTAVHISSVSLNSRFAGEIRRFVVCLDVLRPLSSRLS